VLGKALGEGTFGKVKLGTHILTGEKVSSPFQLFKMSDGALALHEIFKFVIQLSQSGMDGWSIL